MAKIKRHITLGDKKHFDKLKRKRKKLTSGIAHKDKNKYRKYSKAPKLKNNWIDLDKK